MVKISSLTQPGEDEDITNTYQPIIDMGQIREQAKRLHQKGAFVEQQHMMKTNPFYAKREMMVKQRMDGKNLKEEDSMMESSKNTSGFVKERRSSMGNYLEF